MMSPFCRGSSRLIWSCGVGAVPPKRSFIERAPPSKVPSLRVMTISPEAVGRNPPASSSTSMSRVRPRKGLRPGLLTSPTTETDWLWYSLTFTSTCGFTRKSRARRVVSLRCTSATVRPPTGTSPRRGRAMTPLGCTVGVRVRSSLPNTTSSSTSPAPTRYSGGVGLAAGGGGSRAVVGGGGRRGGRRGRLDESGQQQHREHRVHRLTEVPKSPTPICTRKPSVVRLKPGRLERRRSRR